MDAIEIKYLLARKGLTVSDVAKNINVALPSVSQVIHGHCQSVRIAQAVADSIGKSLEEVFPKYRQDKEAA